ncbi:MAG: hypothetical protein KDJ66_15660 [Nitratireductor sp.]|nr:hypothetical protein [Nitratireductor sp.]
MSTQLSAKNTARRAFSDNGPLRHVLVSVLILFGLIGGYMSWKALFAFDPVISGLYSVLAMVAFWGTWTLHRNGKKAESAE